TKEGSKELSVIVHRPAAARASRLLRRDGAIDVGDLGRAQLNAALVEPFEEAIGSPAVDINRRFGQTAFRAHPGLIGADLIAMWMARLLRLIEAAQEAQPSCCAVDEPLAGLGRGGPFASASFRPRPDRGRSLDAGNTHPLPCRQVQKSNRVEKVVRAFEQHRSRST